MRWTANDLARFQARRSGEMTTTAKTRRPSPTRASANPTELQVHIAVAGHLRTRARPGVFWAHYPAGEVRDERTASKLKAMGTKPGVPDMLLLIGGKLHGLELKRDDGRLSPEQRACHREIEAAGGYVATAWGVDSALRILETWGALRVDTTQKGTQAMADYGPQITVARLFRKESAKGALYFAGRMGMAKIALLKSKDVAEDGSEIWHLVMSEQTQRQDQRPRDDGKVNGATGAEPKRESVDRFPSPRDTPLTDGPSDEIPF